MKLPEGVLLRPSYLPHRHVVERLLPKELCRELALVHRVCAVPGYRPGCTSATLAACPAWAWPALLRARELVRDIAEDAFDAFGALWPETTVTVGWLPGSSLPAHSDDCHEHLVARHISAVVWLSTHGVDFAGGEFFFEGGSAGATAQFLEPRAGRAVFFEASDRHGIQEVTSGERLVLLVWFTRDADAAEDPKLLALGAPSLRPTSMEERLHGHGPQTAWPSGRSARRLAYFSCASLGLPLRRRLRPRDTRLAETGFSKLSAALNPGGLTSIGRRGSGSGREVLDDHALSPSRRTELALVAFVAATSSRGIPTRHLGSARHAWRSLAVRGLLRLVRMRERVVDRKLKGWHERGLFDAGPGDHTEVRWPASPRKRPRLAAAPTVECFPRVRGLAVARGALSTVARRRLEAIVDSGFLRTVQAGGTMSNQAMRFGADIPRWAHALSAHCARISGLLSPEVVARKPRFDQLIVNAYLPGQGITRHVDLLKFDDGILGICLGDATATITFRRLHETATVASGYECAVGDQDLDGAEVDVEVRAGDVYALCGEARYRWTHEISAASMKGKRRLSITLRRLLPGSWEGPGPAE